MTPVAILELDNVNKHFGGLAAVNGVTMKADDGEILAIVGPNGAGKSTLLKLIVGLEVPTSGTIRFTGKDITRHPTHRIENPTCGFSVPTCCQCFGETICDCFNCPIRNVA